MNKTKKWIIAALILCGVGIIISIAAFGIAGFTFQGFSDEKYENNRYEIIGDFKAIEIDDETTEIKFVLSEEGNYVECYEKVSQPHQVKIDDEVLEIELSHKSILDFLTFATEKTTMTIHLSGRYYDALKIDTTTGDIEVPEEFLFHEVEIEGSTADIRFDGHVEEEMEVELTTGKMKSVNAQFGTVQVYNTTGGCEMKDVLVAKKIDLKSTTGDITLDSCDAHAVYIQATTGNVSCSFLTNKTFNVDTTTGLIEVPAISQGGMCQIKTTTGNVQGKICE